MGWESSGVLLLVLEVLVHCLYGGYNLHRLVLRCARSSYVSDVYNLYCVELNVMNYEYNLDRAFVALAPLRVS